MVDNINFISIKEILNRILRHPLLKSVDLEQAIQYTIDFIGLTGFPEIHEEKKEDVIIDGYRGVLPCDLISIIQVKLSHSNIVLEGMSGNYDEDSYPSFKTQGTVLFTSFERGCVEITYNAIKTDSDGLPMIPDLPVFLTALELYIKVQVYTDLFDIGKISANVLQNAQQDYDFAAARCTSKFKTPSVSEMQTLTNLFSSVILDKNSFYKGFKNTGPTIRHF